MPEKTQEQFKAEIKKEIMEELKASLDLLNKLKEFHSAKSKNGIEPGGTHRATFS